MDPVTIAFAVLAVLSLAVLFGDRGDDAERDENKAEPFALTHSGLPAWWLLRPP